MLRITTQRDGNTFRLKLEGKLSGPWVDELERTWYAAAESVGEGRVLVDLSEVTFVDAEGKKLLGWMHRQGAEFRCTGCMTRGIVEEIQQAQRMASGSRGTQ